MLAMKDNELNYNLNYNINEKHYPLMAKYHKAICVIDWKYNSIWTFRVKWCLKRMFDFLIGKHRKHLKHNWFQVERYWKDIFTSSYKLMKEELNK